MKFNNKLYISLKTKYIENITSKLTIKRYIIELRSIFMAEKKYNVDSFNLDHTKVTAPYVRLAGKKVGEKGDVVTKFDIRLCQPNKEAMGTGAIHTIEHITAEYIRDEMEGVIDFSPMGCRTGYYLTVWGDRTEKEIAEHMVNVFKKVSVWDKPVPAATEKECGNYKDMDLEGAKYYTGRWVKGIEETGFNCYK